MGQTVGGASVNGLVKILQIRDNTLARDRPAGKRHRRTRYSRNPRGTTASWSGSSLELGVLLKNRGCEKSNRPDFLENNLYGNRLAEFNQNCAKPGLGRMYRKLGTRPLATLYRSRAGLGILGTNFELWVNCKRSSSAA